MNWPEFDSSELFFEALSLEITCLKHARCRFCDKPIYTTLALETFIELNEHWTWLECIALLVQLFDNVYQIVFRTRTFLSGMISVISVYTRMKWKNKEGSLILYTFKRMHSVHSVYLVDEYFLLHQPIPISTVTSLMRDWIVWVYIMAYYSEQPLTLSTPFSAFLFVNMCHHFKYTGALIAYRCIYHCLEYVYKDDSAICSLLLLLWGLRLFFHYKVIWWEQLIRPSLSQNRTFFLIRFGNLEWRENCLRKLR